MKENRENNFLQSKPLKRGEGNKPGHWINKIISQDGSEAGSYENFMETKTGHMKEIEKRRSSQVSEGQTAEPASPVSPKEAQAMGQNIKEAAEQEIAKAFNRMGFKCRTVKK